MLPCTRHGLRPQEMDCVRPSAHGTTLLVDHIMARRGFNTHPLEDYVQGLDHSQLAAMYSRSEVKPSLSIAVSACHGKQSAFGLGQSVYRAAMLMCRTMHKRGYLTYPLDDFVMGFSTAHLPAMHQGMRFSTL